MKIWVALLIIPPVLVVLMEWLDDGYSTTGGGVSTSSSGGVREIEQNLNDAIRAQQQCLQSGSTACREHAARAVSTFEQQRREHYRKYGE
ncbi:MAG: hypothetical protein ACR2QC_11025 [Gammaproteobacteria bacterium]